MEHWGQALSSGTNTGKHEIKCSILCNEYVEPTEQIIVVEVE